MVASKEKLERIDEVTSVDITNEGRSVTVRLMLPVDSDGVYTDIKTAAMSDVMRGLQSDGYMVSVGYMDLVADGQEAKVALRADK